jgi:tRNA threonylcarbamoyladenosine biosynthesis protein TsaE
VPVRQHRSIKRPKQCRYTPARLRPSSASRYYTWVMNTVETWQIKSSNSANTEQLGRSIGQRLRGSEVIELASDLGGGKTTFVRGLAAGMGSKDAVSSPSFTISQLYQADDLSLHHYDFYRLPDAGLMQQELAEVLDDPKAVVVVEWASVVENVLPTERASVAIKTIGENEREFTIILPEKLTYLRSDD